MSQARFPMSLKALTKSGALSQLFNTRVLQPPPAPPDHRLNHDEKVLLRHIEQPLRLRLRIWFLFPAPVPVPTQPPPPHVAFSSFHVQPPRDLSLPCAASTSARSYTSASTKPLRQNVSCHIPFDEQDSGPRCCTLEANCDEPPCITHHLLPKTPLSATPCVCNYRGYMEVRHCRWIQ